MKTGLFAAGFFSAQAEEQACGFLEPGTGNILAAITDPDSFPEAVTLVFTSEAAKWTPHGARGLLNTTVFNRFFSYNPSAKQSAACLQYPVPRDVEPNEFTNDTTNAMFVKALKADPKCPDSNDSISVTTFPPNGTSYDDPCGVYVGNKPTMSRRFCSIGCEPPPSRVPLTSKALNAMQEQRNRRDRKRPHNNHHPRNRPPIHQPPRNGR